MPTSKSSQPKVAYIFKESSPAGNGTWHPVAGYASTSVNYSWTGTHSFSNSVTFDQVLTAKAGVNNFQNPAARDAAITSPANGTVVFIRQDNDGNTIHQIQYYNQPTSSWVNYNQTVVEEKTTSYTIGLHDVNNLIRVNSSSNLEILIPAQASPNSNFPIGSRIEVYRAGTGEVTIQALGASGVTVRSKLNNKRISTQYSGAMITKVGSDEWLLIGDLKA